MKKLILLLLLPVLGIVANNRPHMKDVEQEFGEARMKAHKAGSEFLPKAGKNISDIEEKLRETEEGKMYYSVRKNWSDCADVHGHESPACNQIKQNLERTLALVLEAPMGQYYSSALQDKEYFAERWKGLERMVGFMGSEFHKSQSEEDVMLEAINKIQPKPYRDKPSTVWIEWSNDLVATQGKVREDLRNFVQEMKKH